MNRFSTVKSQRSQLEKQIVYWENVVAGHKNYRDAYFTLALLEYKLGNNVKARMYLDKTFYIDPNFEEGRKLEQLLNKQ